ncbi:MAG: PSD1 and planctomycete cytochrome C domain-containing protein [bacterium]|nr:PSD1 and planctomycete cytochrome C domain-containing protein [bacterium]
MLSLHSCSVLAAQPQSGLVDSLSPAERREAEEFFEAQVRPLLVEHCIECHGPQEQSGELRLDRKNHFTRGGGSGPVVQPGNPQSSLLIRAIGYQDNDLQMPPDSKLPDKAIAVLSEWVRGGAHWPNEKEPAQDNSNHTLSIASVIENQRKSHWSYQTIERALPPRLKNNEPESSAFESAELTPIDYFVRARLAEAGLAPNPQADRRSLIERAYFTLIGLPPTYEEVIAFEQNPRPDAFAQVVDRLLASPHYGERWARHWLDLARYGDTMGYLAGSREERYPFAFTYRDYVIDAFNKDKPYNDFIVEQLAADQLELSEEDRQSLAAMGYLTVGRKFMNRQHDIIDDQIDVVTRGFLGLSVSCARCHDHKYDPIPTADYYSLYGVFASSQEPDELPLLGEPQPSAEYDAFLEAKASKQQEVDRWLEERRVETEQELRSRVADYLVSITEQLPGYRKEDQKPFQGRRGPLRPAAVRNWQQFLIDADRSPDACWQLFRNLALLPPDSFASQAPQLLDHALNTDTSAAPVDGGQSADGKPIQAIPERLLSALRDRKPQSLPEAAAIFGEVLEVVYRQWIESQPADAKQSSGESQAESHTTSLDAAEDAGESEPLQNPAPPWSGDSKDERLLQLLLDPAAPTSLDRDGMIDHLDQGQRNKYNQLLNEVNGVEVTHPGAPPRGMVLVDNPDPVEPVIFRRGEPSNRGEQVPRRFLQVLSHVDGGQPFENGSGRMELAQAITDPKNPLTARVMVNRLWQHHFGEGLVRTPSDFGVRGEPPTHPQLLDYLACELLESGWSLKHLHRNIMLSATWQQASTTRQDAMLADPENRLLWHMPRQRLEFEALRDRLLVAAGRLDGKIGGRSVMIHQDATRRGLYAYIDREDFPGLLASFDVPSPDASRARRAQTTVPQQALYLMNSPFVIEQAKAVAEDCSKCAAVEHVSGDTEAEEYRIRAMFRRALARDPEPPELSAALQFVRRRGTSPAKSAAGAKDQTEDLSDDALDLWEQLAQVLLLSNEFAVVD